MPAPANALFSVGGFDGVMQRYREASGVGSTDKAVAESLGLSTAAYSARKRTQSVPFAEIVERTAERPVDLNYVFVGKAFSGTREDGGAYSVGASVAHVREPDTPPYIPQPDSTGPVRLVQLFGRYSPGLERQAIVGGTNNLPCIEVPERWLAPGERYYANEVWTDAMAAAGIAKGDVVIVRATREPAHGAVVLLNVFKSGFWIREWWPQPDGSAIAKGRALVASEQQDTVFTAEERADVWPLGEAVLVIKRVGQ